MGRITWSSDDSSVALLLNGGMISQPQPQPTNSSAWPPGFRFHPTDEELILYYLKRKVCGRRMKLNMIGEIDVYKCEPWELPEKSVLQTGDKQWFFFSPRDKKYPNGARANRATKRGYWKATGKDRSISRNSRSVGVKKTLIFYDGRAPHGKRTDWVMHEYTMDEGEVKNCNPMQDSYALYKIYRKSGPGPKNGEQYGAPFREEEWSDDDQTHDRLQNTSNMKVLMPELIDRASFDSILGGDQYLPRIDDVEEVLQNLVDDKVLQNLVDVEVLQNLVDEPKLSHHPYDFNLTEVDGDDRRAQPTVKGPLCWEAFSAEEANEASESFERFTDANMSHNIKNPVISPSHPREAPEVTSALDCSLQEDPYRTEGDFVELNDLVDILEPCNSSLENDINDSFLFHDMVGLGEPELYFDAPLSLPDVIVAQDRTAHQPYYIDGFVVDPTTSQLDYPHSFAYNDGGRYYHTTSSELWAHDQNFNVIMEQESSQVSVAPAVPGNVYEGSQTNLNEGAQPSQGGSDIKEGDGVGSSWFTSAVHTLLDSIPTHPASASESALINRAFERVSSFGAVRIGVARNNLDVVPAAGASARTAGRKINGNGGILFISVIVVLLAGLWVLVMGVGRW